MCKGGKLDLKLAYNDCYKNNLVDLNTMIMMMIIIMKINSNNERYFCLISSKQRCDFFCFEYCFNNDQYEMIMADNL